MISSPRAFVAIACLLAACSSKPSDRDSSVSKKESRKPLSPTDSIIAEVCGSAPDTIPYTVVDVGSAAKMSSGREARELIQSEEEWQRRWKALADPAPMPRVSFRDSIVVIVTSAVSDSTPRSLEIEALKQCTGTDDIVVPVRAHRSTVKTATPERSLRAVQIARAVWKTRQLTFFDLPAVVDPPPAK